VEGSVKVARTALGTVLIAFSIPLLQQGFLALAGFLQLKTLTVGFGQAVSAGAAAPLNLALAQAAAVGVLFVLAFPLRSRDEKGLLDALHVRPLAGAIVALCFICGLLLQFPLAEIGNVAQEIWPLSFDELARRYRLVNPTTWWGGMSALLAFVLVAPVTEELVFRGWLLPMVAERWGVVAGLLWTSLLFGLVHAEPGAVIYATVGGLILGAVALRARSTLASIALHAGINATPLLLPVSVIRVEGFNTLPDRIEHISVWVVLASVAAAAALLALLWRNTERPPRDES